jgi:hypothetical protein
VLEAHRFMCGTNTTGVTLALLTARDHKAAYLAYDDLDAATMANPKTILYSMVRDVKPPVTLANT